MSATICWIYSEVNQINPKAPEMAVCLKAIVRQIAPEITLMPGDVQDRVTEIGLRGEFTEEDCTWLRDTFNRWFNVRP